MEVNCKDSFPLWFPPEGPAFHPPPPPQPWPVKCEGLSRDLLRQRGPGSHECTLASMTFLSHDSGGHRHVNILCLGRLWIAACLCSYEVQSVSLPGCGRGLLNPATLRSFRSLMRLLPPSRRESSDWESKATAKWLLLWQPWPLSPVGPNPEKGSFYSSR